jgi:hypothetical protein
MEVSYQLHAPAALPLGREHPYPWIGGWVDPRVSLVVVEKRKMLHSRESNPGRPARSPSLYIYFTKKERSNDTLIRRMMLILKYVAVMRTCIMIPLGCDAVYIGM